MSYIDLITQIKNAQQADKNGLSIPYSKMKREVAELLEDEGFIGSVEVKGKRPKKVLKIGLNSIGIRGHEFLSKPSRRRYKGYEDLWPVKGGHGTLVLSTSQGIMSGEQARQNQVGGQILFEVW